MLREERGRARGGLFARFGAEEEESSPGKTQTHNLSGFRKQVSIRSLRRTRGLFSRDGCLQQ